MWIGKGLRDADPVKRLVQTMFALDSLFQINQGELITPSIAAQMSESVAFILGTDLPSRIDIEKKVKDLWGKRSAVVHQGVTSISGHEDFLAAYLIARRVIARLLNDEPFKDFTSVGQIFDWVRHQRYTCADDTRGPM